MTLHLTDITLTYPDGDGLRRSARREGHDDRRDRPVRLR